MTTALARLGVSIAFPAAGFVYSAATTVTATGTVTALGSAAAGHVTAATDGHGNKRGWSERRRKRMHGRRYVSSPRRLRAPPVINMIIMMACVAVIRCSFSSHTHGFITVATGALRAR